MISRETRIQWLAEARDTIATVEVAEKDPAYSEGGRAVLKLFKMLAERQVLLLEELEREEPKRIIEL